MCLYVLVCVYSLWGYGTYDNERGVFMAHIRLFCLRASLGTLFHAYRALLLTYRALFPTYRALLPTYMALFPTCRALLPVYRALLRHT